MGAHRLVPVATHALFIHRTVAPRSQPVSLSFAALIFHPPDALDSASSPTFFSFCFFFSRYTIYQIRYTNSWRRDWDSFSPLVLLVLQSRPISLSFTAFTSHPPDALDSASSPVDTKCWRTQLQPIRTFGEISAHIKIFPTRQPYLYQKLSRKATQLRLLGMSYGQIAKSLNINGKTATEACKYKGK